MLTGLSLSLCIADIINGRISESEVSRLITGTKAEDEQDFKEVIELYRKLYWSEHPDRAEEIARRFWDAGKLVQPRVKGDYAPDIRRGHWRDEDGSYIYFSMGERRVQAASLKEEEED